MSNYEYSPSSSFTQFGLAAGDTVVFTGTATTAFLSSLVSLLSSAYIIIGILLLSLVSFPIVLYGDKAMENAEFAMRTKVFPIYRDAVRPFLNLLRKIYNPLSCWWNALNWWGYGMVREVLFPLALRCNVKTLFVRIGQFLIAVGSDLVLFIARGRFLSEFVSFQNITPAGIAMFQAWIDVYNCACYDLGMVAQVLPIVNPLIFIPPAYPVYVPLIFFSGEWTDPETWCFLENMVNAVFAVAQQAYLLITQILNLLFNPNYNRPFIRPDFRLLVSHLCPALSCGMRSFENAYQVFWDKFIPFHFTWHNFLCIVDSLACILLKTVDLALRILINIDKVVIYPQDSFWETTIKPDVIEIINLYVAPTNWANVTVPNPPEAPRFVISNYYLDTNVQALPNGKPNPVFNLTRLDKCICNFINRVICDPADESTACFSQGAQNLLIGFDFCCLTNNILMTLSDLVSGLFEFSLHLAKGPDDFFLYIDRQPFSTVIKNDLVKLVRCILSVFGLIPVVGTCIRDLLTGIFDYLASLVDFFFRVLVGLLTLPYFIIALPSIPNFLQAANEAVDYFIAIHEAVITDQGSSIKNCLCVILNNGFPIPPIPCSSCRVAGYVPPPAHKKSGIHFFDPVTQQSMGNDPELLARDLWGHGRSEEAELAFTPLINYGANHTMNPVRLYNMLWMSVHHMTEDVLPFKNLREVDAFFDERKEKLLMRWNERNTCAQRRKEAELLKQQNMRLYQQKLKEGYFSDKRTCGHPTGWYKHNNTLKQNFYEDEMHNHLINLSTEAPRAIPAPSVTTGPTLPAVIGCNPTPDCFDFCCVFRSSLILIVHTIQSLARFFNGIIQGGAGLQGTMQDYPYFTGEFADQGKRTFETDVIQFIIDLFVPIRCACQVLNLIIPVVPSNFTEGRPDICCAVQRLSELIAGIIQTIMNAIMSLALGSTTNFIYFKGGYFYADVSAIFDIVLGLVDCLCVLARAIFPLDYIPGFGDYSDFDICCAAQSILVTVTEILRGITQAVISLATITITNDSFCFWRLDKTVDHPDCAGTLDGIGVIKQIDIIIDSFLPKHGEKGGSCLANCGNDNGASGIVPCICQLFNTLIPFRNNPAKKVSCTSDPLTKNCPLTDFCCPFSKLGFFIADTLKFAVRLLVSLWQPWNGLPEFFINFIFCDEGTVAPCPNLQDIPPTRCELQKYKKIPSCDGIFQVQDENGIWVNRCGAFTCGKLNIAIKDITDPYEGLIARCTCQFIGLLDRLIALLFNILKVILPQSGWSCCFCGGLVPIQGSTNLFDCQINNSTSCTPGYNGRASSGVLPALSYVINAASVAAVGFVRKFPLSCYWKPCVPSPIEPVRCPNNVPQKIDETWIFSFLAPTADALAISVGNLQCFAQSMFLLPQICTQRGQKFLGSVVRWAAELILVVIGFIEAFVSTFIAPDNTCVGPACDQAPGTKVQTTKGVDAKQLGKMMVILLSFPSNLLIGDSEVACTTVCPSVYAVPRPTICGCWNKSPAYGNQQQPDQWVYYNGNDQTQCYTNVTGYTQYGLHIGSKWGYNRTDSLVQVTVANGGANYTLGNVLDVAGGTLGRVWVTSLNGTSVGTIAVANPGAFYSAGTNIPTTGGSGTGATINIVSTITGCCLATNPMAQSADRRILPICVNPDEAVVQPGPCAELTACRPDNLPSIANDPLTPAALSAGYQDAVDGILMGFLRYLRCILSNIIGCDAEGKGCLPIGLVMYPAQLIFSIIWQILGGFIRFSVSMIIFFFSLFTPPKGGECACWKNGVVNAYGATVDQSYARVSGLCYRCHLPGWDCQQTYMNVYGASIYEHIPCQEYCPLVQQVQNPGIDATTAYNKCIALFPNVTSRHNASWVTADLACNSRAYIPFTIPNLCLPWRPNVCGNVTFTNFDWGFYNYGETISFTNGQFGSKEPFIVSDVCPPGCEYNGGSTSGMSSGLANGPRDKGWLPYPGYGGDALGAGMHSNVYPVEPLVVCGLLQIVQNFIDVFNSFVAIFTTPLILPSASATFKRSLDENFQFTGPKIREPIQQFKARLMGKNYDEEVKKHVRYDGTIYGLDTGSPNIAVTLSNALWNYDTSDCFDDPVTCACRNIDIGHVCYVDSVTGQAVYSTAYAKRMKRDVADNVTSIDVINAVAYDVMQGTSVCDHITWDCANMAWDQIKPEDRQQWVRCLDRRTQGERLNAVSSIFPKDFVYNSNAPLTVVNNIFGTAKRYIARHYLPNEHYESAKKAARFAFDDKPDRPSAAEDEQDETLISEEDRIMKEPLLPHDWHDMKMVRNMATREYLKREYGYTDQSMMMDAMVRLDEHHFKYQLGYWGRMLNKAAVSIKRGTSDIQIPSTREALQDVVDSANDLARIIRTQRYAEVATASVHAARILKNATDHFVNEGAFNVWNRFKRYRESMHEMPHIRQRQEEFSNIFYEAPLIKWLYSNETRPLTQEQSGIRTFWNHLKNIAQFQRTHWQSEQFNFFNADLKFWSAADIIMSRWKKPVWTPEKIESWNRLKGVYYMVYDKIWPGQLTPEEKERTSFLANCELLDKTADLTIRVVDYCANDALVNVNFDKKQEYLDNSPFFQHTPYREGTFHSHSNLMKYELKTLTQDDPDQWTRPRLEGPQFFNKEAWMRAEHLRKVDYRSFRRADQEQHGPSRWNLVYWLIARFEDFTEWAFQAESNHWFDILKQWVSNQELDVKQFPNVGLLYWLLAPFRCHFPESFNCSIGAGFERALLWTTVGFAAAFFVAAYFLPFVTIPIQVLGFGLSYVFVLLFVAWHFPPGCLIMSPSFPIPLGIGVPMCAMDELIAFFDKWITNCYSPLIIPTYMIAGETCPTGSNAYIDIYNCADVGVSDGLQNILFAGFWILGQRFCDFALRIASFAGINFIIPGFETYMMNTLNTFKLADSDQFARLQFCFFETLPALGLPAFAVVGAAIVIGITVTPLVLMIRAFLQLFAASFAGQALSDDWDDKEDGALGDQDQADDDEPQEEQGMPTVEQVGRYFFG